MGAKSANSEFREDAQGKPESGQSSAEPQEQETPSQSPGAWRKANFTPRPFSDFEDLPGYSVVRAMSPQPTSAATQASGKKLYLSTCVQCHGEDGSPPHRDAALVPYNMADLSQVQQYKFGSDEKALYRSIAFGVGNPIMTPSEAVYSSQEIWDMVNYVQSLQD